jgi:hypothetical protein
MRTTTLIVDDFYPAPEAVRRAAMHLNYGTKEFLGHKYTGMSTEWLPELIDGYVGAAIGCPIDLRIQYFRLGTKEEKPTTHIHADGDCATHACVWYLSEPPAGTVAGTGLYRHKKLGIDRMVTKEWMDAKGYDEQTFVDNLNADGNDDSKWDMIGLLPQKFNRLVVYETAMFHARFPRDEWGNDASDGRLIWVGFFNKR